MKHPLISICIPTLNGEKYLEEALNSISHQTYRNIEMIVSDDNSTDRTLIIIAEFKRKIDFPVYIYSHSPMGIGANWNNCIKNANGEFIKFLFQDDVLFPRCIEEMVQVINTRKDIGLVASKRKFLIEGDLSPTISKWIFQYKDLQADLGLPKQEINIFDKNLFKHDKFVEIPQNKIGEPTTVLFRKSILKETGDFREDLQQILDFEFYYRLLKKYKIAIINKELAAFRLHPMQATNINRNRPIKDYKEYDKILYRDFFWYLNKGQQQRLFRKFNLIGRGYRKIRNAIKARV